MSAPISASGSSAGATRLSPIATLIAVVAGATFVRLLAGALVPLTEDEAYYRLWSMRPAFGYFDHPPMIAWWIWLGRAIAGDTPLGVRLIPTLATAATSVVTFDLARRLGLRDRAASQAAIWLNATLLVGIAGGLAVPDVPNALFWVVALRCAMRATHDDGRWWLAAGAAAGLACLSKYSALFLAPGSRCGWRCPRRDDSGQDALAVARRADRRRRVRAQRRLERVPRLADLRQAVRPDAPRRDRASVSGQAAARSGAAAQSADRRLCRSGDPSPRGVAAARRQRAVRRLSRAPQPARRGPGPMARAALSAAGDLWGGGCRWDHRLASGDPEGGRAARARLQRGGAGAAGGADRRRAPVPRPAGSLPRLAGLPQPPVERARAVAAAWVGTPTYGVAAQFAASHRIAAPATQILQRARYSFETMPQRADFARPGLVVVSPRDPAASVLPGCFAARRAVAVDHPRAGVSAATYAVYRVSQPRRDVERDGCGDTGAPAPR